MYACDVRSEHKLNLGYQLEKHYRVQYVKLLCAGMMTCGTISMTYIYRNMSPCFISQKPKENGQHFRDNLFPWEVCVPSYANYTDVCC